MKFAIITDVHGNFDALEAVLDDIDRRGDITKIYNLGDNIGVGHETNKVLDAIFERDDMEIIAGNHDEAVMSLVNDTPYPSDLKDKFYEHHQWIENHLDEDYYDALNNLPRVLEKKLIIRMYYLSIMKLRMINYKHQSMVSRLVQLLNRLRIISPSYLKIKMQILLHLVIIIQFIYLMISRQFILTLVR